MANRLFLLPSRIYVNASCIYDECCDVFIRMVFTKFTTYKFSLCWFDGDMFADPCELPVVDPPVFEHPLNIDEIICGGRWSLSNRFSLKIF